MTDLRSSHNDNNIQSDAMNRSSSSSFVSQNTTTTNVPAGAEIARDDISTGHNIPIRDNAIIDAGPIVNTQPIVDTTSMKPGMPIPDTTTTTTKINSGAAATSVTVVNTESNPMLRSTFTMKELIHEMHLSLNDYLTVGRNIPVQNIKESKILMFLSLFKGGVGVGLLMTHNRYKNTWNAPCAISISYASKVPDFPLDKMHYLLLFKNPDTIMSLPSREYLQLGVDIPMSHQKDNDKSLFDNGYLLYPLTKSVDFLTLEGAIITINKHINYDYYYRKNLDEIDIFNGNVIPAFGDDFCSLCRMLNDYIGVKPTDDDKHFKLDQNIPMYQYYVFNNKEWIGSFSQLSQLPTLPFVGDLKKSIKLRITSKLKSWNFGKKIYQSFQHMWHPDKSKNDDKNKEIHILWNCDENVPLYQYYLSHNMLVYNRTQLSALPKFPFLNDIVNKRYSLQKYNPINVMKSYYKSYIKKNRRANAIYNYYYNYNEDNDNNEKHWLFNENMPLYRYYVVYNEDVPEMINSIKYNKAFLSKLSPFPFSKDIKIRKYSLFKYNPYYLGRKMYHQWATRIVDIKDKTLHHQTDKQGNENDNNIKKSHSKNIF